MPTKRLPQWEFVCLIAMLFAMIAFSIDAMLPGLPTMGQDLTPEAPNRIMFVVIIFVIGMGIGTFLTGALSDAFGRRPVILGGIGIYFAGSIIAYFSASLEVLLLARLLQGFGVAGPRVATLALVRDQFEGPQMAKIMSIAMTVFMLVPAVAPLVGQFVIEGLGWRSLFAVFALFALTVGTWMALRQPETLTPENTRKLGFGTYFSAIKEMMSNRIVVISMAVQTLVMGFLFSCISSVQPIFEMTYDKAESFPRWFFLIALISSTSNVLNAKFVVHLGMRKMIMRALLAQLAFTSVVLFIVFTATLPFWLYFLWTASCFLILGFLMGNLTTLALEPMGHIAGITSSIVAGVSTVAAGFIGIPATQMFDGTPRALAVTVFCCVITSVALMIYLGPRPVDDPLGTQLKPRKQA
ncbi:MULTISPECIES: multidrug effflux MFS transporter [Halocynthiibacter]|uniref:Multidrug effflux MFS transporter n=1 Tax=Halocynthiibacter halioticoli TaxID=2986804 RepID=A0AAE3LT28_9RHOB|nr:MULTISPECIES: multidrug effflux MFS transporter [Halocynthiibacter]MCV6824381.1 multidrug effflux MFS transporter [Halocynthiibacter halioticoli]MCW4057382.1 multidrug effflux MFS transporter [Halocynthiibacter sp. SDUM655004]